MYLRCGLVSGAMVLWMLSGCSPEVAQNDNDISFAENGGSIAGAETVATGANTPVGIAGTSSPVANGGTRGAAGVDGRNNRVSTGDKCVDVNVQFSRQTPVVMFVVDRSQSTSTIYGQLEAATAGVGLTRWQALHDAIMDPNGGVVAKTQKELYLGITLFDGGEDLGDANAMNQRLALICNVTGTCDGGTGLATCPRLITVPPAKNNYDAIAAKYNATTAGPGGTTPTALALTEAYKQIEAQVAGGLDKVSKLTPVVILVTDGEPNNCGNPFVADYQGPADQVAAAAKKGIRTFVVGIDTALSGSAPEVQTNLDNLAKLGNTGINIAYTPTNKEELTQTLTSYIDKAGCEVVLNGKIAPGYEGSGKVMLNSEVIKYNDKNGYKVTAEDKILLLGTACDRYTNDATTILHAEFPCESITLK